MKKKIIIIVLLLSVVCVLMCSCWDDFGNVNNLESSNKKQQEELNALVIEGREIMYTAFKEAYEKISGSYTFSKIDYMLQSYVTQLQDVVSNIKINLEYGEISTYRTRWIISADYFNWVGVKGINQTKFNLIYIEVDFNYNVTAKSKRIGRYKVCESDDLSKYHIE